MVHLHDVEQVLGILVQRLELPDKVVADLTRVAQAVHLPPVLVEQLLFLCVGVQEVVDKVCKRGSQPCLEGLSSGGRGLGDVGVTLQHAQAKLPVEVLVGLGQFVSESRHESHERVAHKQELGVLAELGVHDVPRGLSVAAPELVEGQVQRSVVAQLRRDVLRPAVRRRGRCVGLVAPGDQLLPQHDHHTLPVGAGHLGHVAVDDPVPVVHDQVVQRLAGDLVEGAQLPWEVEAAVSRAGLLQVPPPPRLTPQEVQERGGRRDGG